ARRGRVGRAGRGVGRPARRRSRRHGGAGCAPRVVVRRVDHRRRRVPRVALGAIGAAHGSGTVDAPPVAPHPGAARAVTAKPRRARFIAFEGGEASGKSTQAALLAERLDAVLTREPGGTALGAKLRALLLDPAAGDIEPRAEVLLLAADRAQHVAQVVRPALDAGRHVVTDRFAGSSLAYQGFGRCLEVDDV